MFLSVIDNCIENSATILAAIIGAIGTVIAGLIIYCFSRKYQENTRAIENDRMMKELFTEFNKRYDLINGRIDDISKFSLEDWKELKKKKKISFTHTIYDFFNLCAEEYYWYQKDRVDKKVWESWSSGMNKIYNSSDVIKMIWDEECKDEKGIKSYYINDKNNFFKPQN